MTEGAWPPVRRLDAVAAEVARDWGLTLGARLPGRYSYVVAAGDDAILKLTPPEDDESDHEPDALVLWHGDGAARLLRHDARRRAMLLERARPGTDAAALGDDEAMRVAVGVGARLWRAANAPFRPAADEVPRWLRAVAATGHRYVPIAERLFAGMRPRADVVVHGDLHHHNLLRHGARWVAIDPKPYLAEREYDVVTLLWNPRGYVPTRERTESRIGVLAAAGLDGRRIREWAIVRGTYLGLPLDPGDDEAEARQLGVVRALLA